MFRPSASRMKTPAFVNPSIQSDWAWNVLNGGTSMSRGSAVATRIHPTMIVMER
jgi:hypothetical protein